MSKKKKRIAYFSDLHLEHYDDPWDVLFEVCASIEFFEADYVVIAGDFANYADAPRYLAFMVGYLAHVKDIIYVPGNHEFYGGHISDLNTLKHADVPHNVHILSRSSYLSEDGILFVGAVGFPDGSFKNPYGAKYYKTRYNDFKFIKAFGKLGLEYGKADHRAISRELEQEARKKVCITHFLPTPECIAIEYLGDLLNACYVNDYHDVLCRGDIDVWFCGHSHEKRIIEYLGTDICQHAFGYPKDTKGMPLKIAIYEI